MKIITLKFSLSYCNRNFLWNPFFPFFRTPRFCRAPFAKHCFVDIWYGCFKSGLQNLHKVAVQKKNADMCLLNWMQPSDLSNQAVFKPAIVNLFWTGARVLGVSAKCEMMPANPVLQPCIVGLMMLVPYQTPCPCRLFCSLKTTNVTFCLWGCYLSLSKVNKVIKYAVLVTS